MREPRIWDNATDLVPLSQAATEDLEDIVNGTYGFEPDEEIGDVEFTMQYAAILLYERSKGYGP